MHAEIVRQLKDGVRALRGPRPGEAARRLAATARLLAAHQESGDADLQRRLQSAIRRDGREALLRAEGDPAMLAAEAREFGFERVPAAEPFDLAARERALDALLTRGKPEWNIRFDPVTLEMISCEGWSAEALRDTRAWMTESAFGSGGTAGNYWWYFPPASA